MAYYDLYRSAPGWGTSNYQFMNPLQPTYQPQPNWTGLDYYRAHGAVADPDIYDYAWNRVRNHATMGLGKEEARMWHRRAYGGLGDIQIMGPREIGAAAAYEAWRNWKYHYGIYAQPLSGDRERQREAITGIAVSEATRLWQYTGRLTDSYGRLEACESAAATADHILQQSWLLQDGVYDPYPGRGRLSRRSSLSSLRSYSPYAGSRSASPFVGDGYGYPYSTSAYSPSSYGVGYTRGRSYSNAAAYPVNYNYGTPATAYVQPPYTAGYPLSSLRSDITAAIVGIMDTNQDQGTALQADIDTAEVIPLLRTMSTISQCRNPGLKFALPKFYKLPREEGYH